MKVRGSRNIELLSTFLFLHYSKPSLKKVAQVAPASRLHSASSMGAKHYWELTAWQAVRTFKVGIYDLIERKPLADDIKLREQLRESVASAQSHIAEGYGRFDPPDFARFVKMSLASMIECHNHLGDAVDRRRISEETRRERLVRWEAAMKEAGGLLDYLQSPEAKRNAEQLRQTRNERRRRRKKTGPNPEP